MKKIITVIVTWIVLSGMFVNCQWVQIPNGIGNSAFIGGLTANGNNIFASTWDTAYVPGSIYVSTNSGNNWIVKFTLTNDYDVNCLASIGNNIIGGADRNLWLSTNNGTNWIISLPNKDVLGLGVIGVYAFAGTYWSGTNELLRSSDNGISWIHCNLNKLAYCFAGNGSYFFAGTKENGVYISNDNGLNWDEAGLLNTEVKSIAALNGKVYAGTENGLYVTSNNGANWNLTTVNSGYVFSIIVSSNNLLASVPQIGIYLSTNNGVNWILKNEGLPTSYGTLNLLEANNYLFLGSYGNSVYRRSSSQVFGIELISSEIPVKFCLSQNYPNPFNPTTKIRFDVSKFENVTITVFDALGRDLETIVNQTVSPGIYETEWNGSKYPSGVYFYKLMTDNFSATKKMVLLK